MELTDATSFVSVKSAIMDERSRKKTLANMFNVIFLKKKYKFQRIDWYDRNTSMFTMSISYDEHDIMLYELFWEIGSNSIKVVSQMTNRQQAPWTVHLDDHPNLFSLLSLINLQIVLGKLCYNYKTRHLTYEIWMSNIPNNSSISDIEKLQEGIFKHAWKYVLEISNGLILFNSNPNLSPKEIRDLAPKYAYQEDISDIEKENFEKIMEDLKVKENNTVKPEFFILNHDHLEIFSKWNLFPEQEIYRGCYLPLKCLITQISSEKDWTKNKQNKFFETIQKFLPLQYESLPAVYGIVKAKVVKRGNNYQFVESEEKDGNVYLITQDYNGVIYKSDDAINFLK
jgi:hypothetical protein